MKKQTSKRKWIIAILVIIAVSISTGYYFLFWSKASFDPVFLSSTETQMWQAYYNKDKPKLAWLLIQILKRQFSITSYEAAKTGKLLANSAMKFKTAKGGKYDVALPDLIAAYTAKKKYSALKYDPEEAAKADLAWWVDRRNLEKRNNPEIIGKGITRLYEVIYGYKHPGFDKAGQLRAKAAYLRDQGKDKCDWKKIEQLLLESYKALQQGIDKKPV
ncbi:hypothetical protein H8D64_00705 [PVC group bacterium]|nr:hypothetical protein [PVC group bacterium]